MIKVCGYCGEEFNGRTRNKFCSRKCAYEKIKLRSKVKVVCLWCGKEKEIYKSHWDQNPNKIFYCDFDCRDAARSAFVLDKSVEERRRKEYPKEKCVWCGKDFEMYPSSYERNKSKEFHCSVSCVREHRKTTVGLLHPRGDGGDVKCDYCGKTHYKMKSLIIKNKVHFCDEICRKKYEHENIISDIKKYVRSSFRSTKLREDCFTRDGYKSVISGIGGRIQHHHLNSLSLLFKMNEICYGNFEQFHSIIFDLDNVVTLTKKEHVDFHKAYGYKIRQSSLKNLEITI